LKRYVGRLGVSAALAKAVSAAEAISITPTPSASGGAMCGTTSAPTASMTNVRIAIVSLVNIRGDQIDAMADNGLLAAKRRRNFMRAILD